MQQLILVIHILAALAVIGLVLLQHGKGADVGASFGSGAANTMFGSVGPASFLMKLTGALAVVFFATSIFLGYLASQQVAATPFNYKAPATQSMPVAPESTVPSTSTPVGTTAPTPAPTSSAPVETTTSTPATTPAAPSSSNAPVKKSSSE